MRLPPECRSHEPPMYQLVQKSLGLSIVFLQSQRIAFAWHRVAGYHMGLEVGERLLEACFSRRADRHLAKS